MSLPSCQPDAQHSSTLQLTLIFACWETRRNHATAMHSFRLQMFQRQHGPTRKTAAAYRLPAQKVQESQLFSHGCFGVTLRSSITMTKLDNVDPAFATNEPIIEAGIQMEDWLWRFGVALASFLSEKKQLCNTLLGAPV